MISRNTVNVSSLIYFYGEISFPFFPFKFLFLHPTIFSSILPTTPKFMYRLVKSVGRGAGVQSRLCNGSCVTQPVNDIRSLRLLICEVQRLVCSPPRGNSYTTLVMGTPTHWTFINIVTTLPSSYHWPSLCLHFSEIHLPLSFPKWENEQGPSSLWESSLWESSLWPLPGAHVSQFKYIYSFDISFFIN